MRRIDVLQWIIAERVIAMVYMLERKVLEKINAYYVAPVLYSQLMKP